MFTLSPNRNLFAAGFHSTSYYIHQHTKRYVMFLALPAALLFFFFSFTSSNIFHRDIEKWKWNVITRQLFVFAVCIYSLAKTKCRLTLSSGMNMKWIELLSFTENHAQIWHIQLSWNEYDLKFYSIPDIKNRIQLFRTVEDFTRILSLSLLDIALWIENNWREFNVDYLIRWISICVSSECYSLK